MTGETGGTGRATPRLINRRLGLLFVAMVGTTVSFYLLLSVVPLYATSVGAGSSGAGLATAALMLSAVAAELVTPWLVARLGYRVALATGLLLLGVPPLGLAGSTSQAVILAVCAVRGLGFGLLVVVGSALVAMFVPRQRQGEGLGVYGIVVGAPGIVALPLGVWLAENVSYSVTFVAGGLSALVGLAVVVGIPGRVSSPAPEQAVGILAGLREPVLVRPAVIFTTTTMAAGAFVTFLPLAVSDASSDLAAMALLAHTGMSALTRWWAGRHGDRHGPGRLLLPGVLLTAGGLLALVLTGSAVAVLAGSVVFGAGFGMTQNASLAAMFARSSPAAYGTVSAMWNAAYDVGLGLGAAAFGFVGSYTGYSAAFALTTGLILIAIAPAWTDRKALPSGSTSLTIPPRKTLAK